MIRPLLSALAAIFLLVPAVFADEPKALVDARSAYQHQSPHPDEAARSAYLTRLVKMREGFAHSSDTAAWKAVDAEFRRNPVPKEADPKALAHLLVGKWRSPRHDYLFKQDGTWTMLPAEPDATSGKWRLKGNQFYNGVTPEDSGPYTLLLLTDRHLVYADKEAVFYETRIGK